LEHRLGATYFLFVYIASAVGGGLASLYGHTEAFLGVGASGGISGIVGGLLCLTILGKLALSPQFFIVTIGVNGVLAARVAHVDWIAHLGGFTAGFAACAVLNNLEGLNRYWLKCKFPEFVKFAIATACLLGLSVLFLEMASVSQSVRTHAIEWSVGILLSVKLADLILDHRKGLAVLAMGTAVFYGLLPFALSTVFQPYCGKGLLSTASSSALREAARLLDAACEHAAFWTLVLGLIVFGVALLILRPELLRGLRDVGFVANTLRAERNRRRGL
jgi:rhomboid protease GluP